MRCAVNVAVMTENTVEAPPTYDMRLFGSGHVVAHSWNTKHILLKSHI